MSIKTSILTDNDPLDAVLAGAEKLYKPVSATLGPRGRYVLYRQYNRSVGTTNDGVTVSKLVHSDDDAEDAVIDYIRESSLKLDATTGDSTTTVVVLTYHILKEAIAVIKQGENPMKLRLALEALEDSITQQIKDNTDKDVTLEKLVNIATTSAKDRKIGKEVAEIVWNAGTETPIMLGFSDNESTYSEVINGFKIDSGPASPYFIRQGVATEIINPYVVVVDAKLRDKEDILPLLRVGATIPDTERKLLFVVSDIAGDALQFLVANHTKGFAEIACARVPEAIQSHTEYLSDFALTCGAKLISRDGSTALKDVTKDAFGRAEKVTVQPTETVVMNGQRIEEDFKGHIASLQVMKETHKTKAGRKFADDRLKMLEQKVISIFVGGQNSKDAEERHYAYEDALGASKAALRGGIVPGGGTLLCMASQPIMLRGDAGRVLGIALCKPLDIIWENAGIDVTEWSAEINIGKGIDVMHPEEGIIDLVKRGIVDPAESEIECVRTAINIAGHLITTGALITERNDHEQTEQPFSVNQG